MRHLLSPNRWSCIPTSFAMVLNKSVEELIAAIGHDGSELINGRVRAFHIQELIDACYQFNQLVTCIEPLPISQTSDGFQFPIHYKEGNTERFMRYVDRYSGVFVGHGIQSGQNHAVAWCNQTKRIYDPSGKVYCLNDYPIRQFYLCNPIN